MSSIYSSPETNSEVTFHLHPPNVAGHRIRGVEAEMIACILSRGLIPCLEEIQRYLPIHESYGKNREDVTDWLKELQQGKLAVLAQYIVEQETPLWDDFELLCEKISQGPPLEKGLLDEKNVKYTAIHYAGIPVDAANHLKKNIVFLRQMLDLLLATNDGMRASGLTVTSALGVTEAQGNRTLVSRAYRRALPPRKNLHHGHFRISPDVTYDIATSVRLLSHPISHSGERLTATLGPDVPDHIDSFISQCGLTSDDIHRLRAPIEGEIWKLGVDPKSGKDVIGRFHPGASFLSDLSSALSEANATCMPMYNDPQSHAGPSGTGGSTN